MAIVLRLQLSRTEEEPEVRKPAAEVLNSQTVVNAVVRVLDANDWNLMRSTEICEREALESAIGRSKGNQSQAARLLGITPRSVYNKVRINVAVDRDKCS
jgi:transcriptional regulator with GAF, ATPase, and Fis domain